MVRDGINERTKTAFSPISEKGAEAAAEGLEAPREKLFMKSISLISKELEATKQFLSGYNG